MVASTASAAPATRKHKSSPLLRIQSSTLSLKLPRLQRRLKGPRRAYPTPPIRLVQPGLCLGRAFYSNLTQAGIRRSPAARADMAAPSAISPAVPFQSSKGRVFMGIPRGWGRLINSSNPPNNSVGVTKRSQTHPREMFVTMVTGSALGARGGMVMSELELHIQDAHIIVNLPDTRLTMTYQASSDAPWLVELPLWTGDDRNAPISLNEFRGRAWQAANKKARELGWIV
jgi:hypothetical protein